MAHRVPERLDGLARQDAAGGVGDGTGDHHRNARQAPGSTHGLYLVDGKQRGLGIEGVEDGLDQEHVGPALLQPARLLQIGGTQFLEGDVARARVVHVRRDGGRLRLGTEGAGHIARALGGTVFVAGGTGQPGRDHVHFVGQFRQVVVGLGHRGGAEGVGLDQVRAGSQVLLVDFLDDVRPGEREQLVVALHIVGMVTETLAAVVVLTQSVLLDHRAHGAVEDQDALGHQFTQAGFDGPHGRSLRAGSGGRSGSSGFGVHGYGDRTKKEGSTTPGGQGKIMAPTEVGP